MQLKVYEIAGSAATQLKVYEIAWGETQTSSGSIAGDVISYNLTFSDQGVQGPPGPQGLTGPANVLTVGSVTTGAPGSSAAATISGVSPAQTLSLTIPRGDVGPQGSTGPANTITIGTVTTGAAGSSASATITGTAPNQTLSLTIPRGDQGVSGTTALTTRGDLLYRDTSETQRLPIGLSGQILKVSAGGIPEWGAAPATGVTSVALSSTDLTVSGSPVTSSGTITANLTNSGVSAGTYSKVTVDAKGRVTTGATATPSDISLGDSVQEFTRSSPYGSTTQLTRDAATPSAALSDYSKLLDAKDLVYERSNNETPTPLRVIIDGKQASGSYATLVGGKVPSDQLPSFVDDVVEYANLAAFPVTGESGKIYVAIDTRKTYRWSGSAYVEISPSEVTSVAGRTGAVTLAVADVSDAVPTSRSISAGTGLTGGGDLTANRTLAVSYGTTSGTACQGNDARLSDSRTPTAHAASHAAAGSDPVFDQNLNTTDAVEFATVVITGTLDASQAGSTFLAPISTSIALQDIASTFFGTLRTDDDSLTANRTYDLPDASGTLALESEVRFDASGSYTYTGQSASGSLESAAVWFIRRSEFSSAGSYVGTTTANNVEWDDRLTATYT